MPTPTEIIKPYLKYCDKFDVHCPCPKCRMEKRKRRCPVNPCQYCQFMIILCQKKVLGQQLINEHVKENTECQNPLK